MSDDIQYLAEYIMNQINGLTNSLSGLNQIKYIKIALECLIVDLAQKQSSMQGSELDLELKLDNIDKTPLELQKQGIDLDVSDKTMLTKYILQIRNTIVKPITAIIDACHSYDLAQVQHNKKILAANEAYFVKLLNNDLHRSRCIKLDDDHHDPHYDLYWSCATCPPKNPPYPDTSDDEDDLNYQDDIHTPFHFFNTTHLSASAAAPPSDIPKPNAQSS